MNFKLNSLAVALGVAFAAGHASAAITLPSTGGSELFAVIYDNEQGGDKASFTLDLGIAFASFLPNSAVTGLGYTTGRINLSANSNWQNFINATDSSPELRYVVVAGDSTGGTAAGGQRFMGTGANNPWAGKQNQNISNNYALPINTFASYVNGRPAPGTHGSEANGSVVLRNSDPGTNNFGESGTMTPTWNGFTADMSGALGTKLNFYLATRGGSNSNTGLATVTQYENANGAAKWDFFQDQGSYFLEYTAPVPEPESWALMLAGAALVGGIVRRRRAK